jgi:uncharacterized protein (TIGR03067 family)
MRHLAYITVAVVALFPPALWGADGEVDDLARDRQQVRGAWNVIAYDQDGRALPADIVKKMRVTIEADRIVIRPKVVAHHTATFKDGGQQVSVKFGIEEGKVDRATYRLDRVKQLKVIELTEDVSGDSRKIRGLYALDGDTLTICLPLPDRKLPKKMPPSPKAGLVRLVLQRAPAAKPEDTPPAPR